jgi:hypothetical protein
MTIITWTVIVGSWSLIIVLFNVTEITIVASPFHKSIIWGNFQASLFSQVGFF